jgi:adenylyl-sulfate kinase
MHKGFTVWLTGLSGAGKSTPACMLERRLRALGRKVEVLDGDVVRTHLCKGLGYTKEDRDENIRRIGFVCEMLSRNDVIAIAAVISLYREARNQVRARIRDFIEVYVECPMDVLIERDVKGLYKKALAGRSLTLLASPIHMSLRPRPRLRYTPHWRHRNKASSEYGPSSRPGPDLRGGSPPAMKSAIPHRTQHRFAPSDRRC